MAKKEQEPKIILEREYIIPLRREWLKVPEYKRANKAVKAIKQFLVRHMKVYDRDLRKIKVDILLNNELRFRGMRKPPAKIKVKAKKFDNDIVKVELAEIPKIIQYKLDREKRIAEKSEKEKSEEKKRAEEMRKAAEAAKAEAKEEREEKVEAEKVEERKEKREATKEAGLQRADKMAKQRKHEVGGKVKQPKIHRMALQK